MARKGQAVLRRVATVVAYGGARTDVLNAIAEEVAVFLNADETLIGATSPTPRCPISRRAAASSLSWAIGEARR